jgi:hypothetical protein
MIHIRSTMICCSSSNSYHSPSQHIESQSISLSSWSPISLPPPHDLQSLSSCDKNNGVSYPPPHNPTHGGYSSTTTCYQQPSTILTYQKPLETSKSFLYGFLSVIAAFTTVLATTIIISHFIFKSCDPKFRVNLATLNLLNDINSALTAKWDFEQ